MTKEQIKEIYWWEVKSFYEGGMNMDDLFSLLVEAYQDGYDDGLADQKDFFV